MCDLLGSSGTFHVCLTLGGPLSIKNQNGEIKRRWNNPEIERSRSESLLGLPGEGGCALVIICQIACQVSLCPWEGLDDS